MLVAMSSPRFHFVVGRGLGPAGRPPWPDRHRDFGGELDGDEGWTAWRLAGSNHRELGRSARVFAGLDSAQAAARQLQQVILGATVHISALPDGSWAWRLSVGSDDVAASARGYARHRECLYNLDAFTSAVAVADLSPHLPRPRRPRTTDRTPMTTPVGTAEG
jgi:hypothetical protein